METAATEIRIYADKNGKFRVPKKYQADVFYGDNIKAVVAFLYSEGVVANDRIAAFINSLSGDTLSVSTGSIYGFCDRFAEECSKIRPALENMLLNSEVIRTDGTAITTNGKQTYIRNTSTEDCVLYYNCERKNPETPEKIKALKEYTGTLVHDHETGLYHFGARHGECNVHLNRYLQKKHRGNREFVE